jgi:hypothetical protein
MNAPTYYMPVQVGDYYKLTINRSLNQLRWAFDGQSSKGLDYVVIRDDQLKFSLRWMHPDVDHVRCTALATFDSPWSGAFNDYCRLCVARFTVDVEGRELKPSIVFLGQTFVPVAKVPLTLIKDMFK